MPTIMERLPTMLWNTRPRSRGTDAHDRWNAHAASARAFGVGRSTTPRPPLLPCGRGRRAASSASDNSGGNVLWLRHPRGRVALRAWGARAPMVPPMAEAHRCLEETGKGRAPPLDLVARPWCSHPLARISPCPSPLVIRPPSAIVLATLTGQADPIGHAA